MGPTPGRRAAARRRWLSGRRPTSYTRPSAVSRITGLRLDLNLRDRHAAAYYQNYKERHQLGGFISCTNVSTLRVKKKRKQRLSLG
mmetsp:Transcript_7423/g.23817  ORF Transcript_7423/g.23817 Transcript_7423/m.23817 type:complete len:86 (-) Transcript_7423:300-557(-)